MILVPDIRGLVGLPERIDTRGVSGSRTKNEDPDSKGLPDCCALVETESANTNPAKSKTC
jgi:hypothetical protein